MDLVNVAAYRPKRGGFDCEAEARRESRRAHHAEFVFRETAVGLADGSYDFRFEVRLPVHEIDDFSRVVPHQQAVDRKVAAFDIFLRGLRVNDAVRVAAITIAHVRAERGHLDFEAITRNQDHSELRTDRDALGEQPHHLFRRGIGGHVVIGGLQAEKQVAHASAHQQRLITAAAERVADRVGQFSWRHAVIMRQSGPRREISVLQCSCRARLLRGAALLSLFQRNPDEPLLAAKDEASNIIGLARGAHEFIDALDQELKGLLSIPIRQIANGAEPAGVAKFFS